MTTLLYLMPMALFLGGMSLVAFLWALRSGQYEDLDGAGARILLDSPPERESVPNEQAQPRAIQD